MRYGMKEKIHAVSDRDLDGLLESLGLTEDLANGKLNCYCCGSKLSKENIGCIYPIKNEVKLCCSTLDCLEKALEETTPTRKISGEKPSEQ
jgi:hypothetical protein